jgi:hypothetical protein
MFDYLGTFTELQLRERNAWLDTQIHAMKDSLDHLRTELTRLIQTTSNDVGSGDRTVTFTHEQNGVGYTLGSVTGAKVFSGASSLHDRIEVWAENSRYLMRVDPFNNDISLGDATWKPDAKLPLVNAATIDNVAGDDSVAAERSKRLTKPFRGLMKRQEYLEEKSKKVKYRRLMIEDEIADKEAMLEDFYSEIEAIEALLANSRTITNSAGETETVSEYETVGVEAKDDIINPSSTEVTNFFDMILPAAGPEDPASDQGDPSTESISPSVVDEETDRERILEAINNQPNASIDDLIAVFPNTNPSAGTGSGINAPSAVIPKWKMQLLANIHAYASESLRQVSFTSYLFRKGSSATYRKGDLLALNAAAGLELWAKDVYDAYGISIRCTELWPPSVDHLSLGGHFTGYSADVTFALDQEKLALDTNFGRGVLTHEFIENVATYGVEQGYFSKYLNEYKIATKFSNGHHLHIEWVGIDRKLINVARLQNVEAKSGFAATPYTASPSE